MYARVKLIIFLSEVHIWYYKIRQIDQTKSFKQEEYKRQYKKKLTENHYKKDQTKL